ncbi:MAG: hypothetical protein FJ217_00510 [Ignavibacteria bacterium]|nr:hypothetical protein [Ignavibacteria bacterium]
MVAIRRNEDIGTLAIDEEGSIAALRDLFSDLDRLGAIRANQIAAAIDTIAPRPGAMVYMMARPLANPRGDLQPVVFSALDVNTHLQVAQLYLTLTFASAVDFLEFAREKYPFPIAHVRTPAEEPFSNSASNGRALEFGRLAEERGIHHTAMKDPSNEQLFILLSRLTFGGLLAGSVNFHSERVLVRDLMNFLFFHNNHRSIPSLAGKTPLQKLKTTGCHHLRAFDPFAWLTR